MPYALIPYSHINLAVSETAELPATIAADKVPEQATIVQNKCWR